MLTAYNETEGQQWFRKGLYIKLSPLNLRFDGLFKKTKFVLNRNFGTVQTGNERAMNSLTFYMQMIKNR